MKIEDKFTSEDDGFIFLRVNIIGNTDGERENIIYHMYVKDFKRTLKEKMPGNGILIYLCSYPSPERFDFTRSKNNKSGKYEPYIPYYGSDLIGYFNGPGKKLLKYEELTSQEKWDVYMSGYPAVREWIDRKNNQTSIFDIPKDKPESKRKINPIRQQIKDILKEEALYHNPVIKLLRFLRKNEII